jgi:hypothetical protein
MFRTSRMASRGRVALTRIRDRRLAPPERRAAKAERAAERQLRRERDNEHSAAGRAAALEAERRRFPSDW